MLDDRARLVVVLHQLSLADLDRRAELLLDRLDLVVILEHRLEIDRADDRRGGRLEAAAGAVAVRRCVGPLDCADRPWAPGPSKARPGRRLPPGSARSPRPYEAKHPSVQLLFYRGGAFQSDGVPWRSFLPWSRHAGSDQPGCSGCPDRVCALSRSCRLSRLDPSASGTSGPDGGRPSDGPFASPGGDSPHSAPIGGGGQVEPVRIWPGAARRRAPPCDSSSLRDSEALRLGTTQIGRTSSAW